MLRAWVRAWVRGSLRPEQLRRPPRPRWEGRSACAPPTSSKPMKRPRGGPDDGLLTPQNPAASASAHETTLAGVTTVLVTPTSRRTAKRQVLCCWPFAQLEQANRQSPGGKGIALTALLTSPGVAARRGFPTGQTNKRRDRTRRPPRDTLFASESKQITGPKRCCNPMV